MQKIGLCIPTSDWLVCWLNVVKNVAVPSAFAFRLPRGRDGRVHVFYGGDGVKPGTLCIELIIIYYLRIGHFVSLCLGHS